MPLAWIESDQNPFGCSVFDVSEFATSTRSGAANPGAAATFLALRNSNGADLRDLLPGEAFAVPCDLTYPLDAQPIDGPLYKAKAMEQKWDLYLWGGAIYITRSWTGTLAYVAHLGPLTAPYSFHIQRVTADREVTGHSPHLARRQVDFILRSHYYRQKIPHPLPDTLAEEAKAIATYSFSMFGDHGLYATFEDTTEILRHELQAPG